MTEKVDGALLRIESKIKHGKVKRKGAKLKSEVLNKILDPEIKDLVKGGDNVNKMERKEINKENRKHAHDVVADAKAELSKEVGRDLGLKMS